MTKINIDRLSEAELVDLHHRIVERLRFLEQMRAHARMLDFSIGDRVCFESGNHGLIEGTSHAPEIRDQILVRLRHSRAAGLGDEPHHGPAGAGWSPEHIAVLREIRDLACRTG